MEVTILKDQNKAKDKDGKVYNVEGIELTRERGEKVFYDTTTKFYKTATHEGVKFRARASEDNNIILL